MNMIQLKHQGMTFIKDTRTLEKQQHTGWEQHGRMKGSDMKGNVLPLSATRGQRQHAVAASPPALGRQQSTPSRSTSTDAEIARLVTHKTSQQTKATLC